MSKFFIITPFYNVEKWIVNNIKSVKCQTHTNFRHVLIDDLSTDKTSLKIKDLIRNDDRFILIENKCKKYAMQNIYDTLTSLKIDDEEIIVSLDGDDWFSSEKTLEKINSAYEKENCLLTFGSYVEYPQGIRGKFSRKIPEDIIENKKFRQAPWMTSHLRSYKFKLWKKIKKESFIDIDGEFYKKTCDLALMFPMLEMAGKRIRFIEDILYVYNTENDMNDHKDNHTQQLMIEQRIRKLPVYEELRDF